MSQRPHDILRYAVRAGRDALRGQLPDRYRGEFAEEFQALARAALAPGLRILDAGSGRQPIIPIDQRPPGCHYVGLDLSLSELTRAPPVPMTGSWLSWQHGRMRPTAYRRNARSPRDRQAFEDVRMQAGQLFAAATPKPRSPASSASPGRTSAAGAPAGATAGWRRCTALARPGRTRACRRPSSRPSTRRCARAPAPTVSTPTTGPWPASPP
jgi:hypothetical protein